MIIAREDAEAREERIPRLRARLRKLQRCVAYNAAAVALLEYWAMHGSDKPLPKVAAILGFSADDLYAAKKLIERKAQNILADEAEEGDES